MNLPWSRYVLSLLLAGFASTAWATELAVSDAWIRLLPGEAPAGGYFILRSGGNHREVLIGVTSTAFGQAMMHRTTEEGGLSRMRPVDAVEIPTRGRVVFSPGGYHLMLTGPKRKLAVGDRVEITLEFEGGQKLSIPFEVRGPGGK